MPLGRLILVSNIISAPYIFVLYYRVLFLNYESTPLDYPVCTDFFRWYGAHRASADSSVCPRWGTAVGAASFREWRSGFPDPRSRGGAPALIEANARAFRITNAQTVPTCGTGGKATKAGKTNSAAGGGYSGPRSGSSGNHYADASAPKRRGAVCSHQRRCGADILHRSG